MTTNNKYKPEPIEVEPGFFVVKETGFIPVSKEGTVINRYGEITVGTPNSKELKSCYYKYAGVNVHRLIALTFLECPGDPKDYQVNHKDGNPSNNRLSNLEWCTPKENVNHALDMKLRQRTHIVVKDLRTGEMTTYQDAQTAAAAIGANKSTLSMYLRSDRTKPYRRFYSVIRRDENQELLNVLTY